VEFRSLSEIIEYVREAYRVQGRRNADGTVERLELAVARPSPLIERAIAFHGPVGVTNATLRRELVPPIASARFEHALSDLESSALIVRSLERRRDRRGRLRAQVVWRTAAFADPRLT
jgi:hypothetical protein